MLDANDIIKTVRDKLNVAVENHGFDKVLELSMRQGQYDLVTTATLTSSV